MPHDATDPETDVLLLDTDAAPSGDWRVVATDILAALTAREHRIWAHVAWHGSPNVPPQDHIADAQPCSNQASIDTSADDHEASGILAPAQWKRYSSAALEQDPDEPESRETGRPRASVVMAVMRLARKFTSWEDLLATLAAPGGITFLASGMPELDGTFEQIVGAIAAADQHIPRVPKLAACTLGEVFVIGDHSREGPFGVFSVDIKRWIEEGRPMVVVGAAPAMMRSELKAMVDRVIDVAPFDREMLCAALNSLYLGETVQAEDIPQHLGEAELARLSSEALTIAVRAATPTAAIQRLVADLPPSAQNGPGLAEFPLQPSVREPVNQLLADLRAWKDGSIPWSDVSRGVLLVGPPGCGKTELPRLIANEACVSVHAASMAKWQSGGARSSDICREMRAFFTKAAAAAPCIVFIDELDTFGDRDRPHHHNSAWTDMVIGALLECLDGYETGDGVVVMAATNLLHKIDAALRRPGRFDRVVTVGHPTPDLMPAAFRWHLRGDLAAADLSPLVAAAAGMTGAEVADSVRRARALARRAGHPLRLDDLTAAIAAARPPLDEGLRWQVAVHECGHAIVAHATGRARPKQLSLHAGGGAADMTRVASNLHRGDFDDELACGLAGRAAERLIFGQPSGGAGGAEESDLAHATMVAAAIELSYGLGTTGTAWCGPPEKALLQVRLAPEVRGRVQDHLDAAEARAIAILRTNRSLLEDMAHELSRASLLTGPVLASFLARVEPHTTEGPELAASARQTPPNADGSATRAQIAPDPEGGSTDVSMRPRL